MENFVVFRKHMLKSLNFLETKVREDFIRRQWKLLRNGERGADIHNAACIAWIRCGGEV